MVQVGSERAATRFLICTEVSSFSKQNAGYLDELKIWQKTFLIMNTVLLNVKMSDIGR